MGITQAEAAETAGVAQTYVSNLENGHNRPGVISLLANLADQYETGLDYVFGRTDEPTFRRKAPLGENAHRIALLLKTLPGHRQADLVALAEGLVLSEKRRYAFWQVVVCDSCHVPLEGGVNERGEIYYVHKSETCEHQSIKEEVLIDVIIRVAQTLNESVGNGEREEKELGLEASLRDLARKLGWIKARPKSERPSLDLIAKDIFALDDRSIAQAWLSRHFKIFLKENNELTVELL